MSVNSDLTALFVYKQLIRMNYMKLVTALFMGIMLSACASVPTVETMVAEGGEIVVGGVGSLIGEDGATLTAVDGTWISYLAPDGKKEVSIKPLNARETLSWRFNENGIYCEVMFKSRSELCFGDDTVLVKSASGVFSQFRDGKKGKYPFKVTSGNTNGI